MQQSSNGASKRTLAPILRHEVREEHLKMVLEHRRKIGFGDEVRVAA